MGIAVREHPSDLLLIHAAELATCSNAPRGDACPDSDGPLRGAAMRDIGIIRDGAIAVRSGIIVDVGTTQEVLSREPSGDASTGTSGAPGQLRSSCVWPHCASGICRCHTHLVFAGSDTEST